MTTIKDISTLLGLSVTTVSRALNGYPEVSAATRARVEQAARDLDYAPNQIARRLVTGRSNVIALVLNATPDLQVDPYVFEIVAGLSAHLVTRGRDMLLHVATEADPVAPLRRLVAGKSIDGFLLNGPEVDDSRIAYLQDAAMPFVLHGRQDAFADYPYYDVDNRGAGRLATLALIRLGHRRIAMVNGRLGLAFASERLAGYREAMRAQGLVAPDAFVSHCSTPDAEAAAFAARALQGMFGAPPTAFVCASTRHAAGVYRAARSLGLAVGEDVSVVSHDDVYQHLSADAFDPPLSTIHAPLRDACMPLAAMICDLIDGKMETPRQVTAEVVLMSRASSAAPPDDAGGWR